MEREEAVDDFRKWNFKLLSLMEMKMKGNGKISGYGVSGICAEAQEHKRFRKGVTVLQSDVYEFECDSSRLM